ncbi:MarR family transcriptional regulator [Pseudoclavibacter sp. RFBJ3]|uniref:MarR family winged helix-turn-helix transcriptional regulator n=1 Tax=unclassified Pseudoclavibacter TaxID=2615177 RepID=UPI000CE87534|nr:MULTISPECIES: MarR family transcriptional regulator [unclassified Pseudoclavibacter]MBF4459299.1 MarR family transcriptional regulator [Pseudoclavibacter sp. VKM Ac-2867]PPF40163.1 MarR family transcriptional regulator [Pseudoclavibacter sp. AY1H1]PPF75832.1 MarR family transcriptional regulator [Pseudoclavibacter sp. Z016]PPF84436.1 MarR family transcriptional regulator [Pseudoclavibacter sp. RFBJ5]PPF92663.1 MarR family transcriptional regulator [Pseudoclavibacter sp. RFBJ3]
MDLLALDKQLCFALAAASRSVISLYRPILEPLGLTHPQYLVMLGLWENDGQTLGQLARALHLEPATLSPLVKRLETSGLVTRSRRPDDERAVEIRLTPPGLELRAKAEEVPVKVVAELGWTLPELEALKDTLTRLLDDSTTARAEGAREPRS